MTIIKARINKIETVSLNYYKIYFKPISNCYSSIFASLVRKILFTSVYGAGITEVKIYNSSNEYDNLPGIKEDVLNIILNLKGVVFKLKNIKKIILSLNQSGKKIVKAKDIELIDGVKILNKEHIIAHLSDFSTLNIKIKIEEGRGYVPYKTNNYKKKLDIDGYLIDTYFCPIIRASYVIEKESNDLYDDLDIIIFYIETNGSLTAKKALEQAIGILLYQLSDFKIIKKEKVNLVVKKTYTNLNKNLFIPLSDIEFSFRAFKCLKKININYIGDLVKYSDKDLLKVKNLGKTTLKEIKKNLDKLNLCLGTIIKNWDSILLDYINDIKNLDET